MEKKKSFWQANRDEIDSVIFILSLGAVITFVCVYFLLLAIANNNLTDIVGMVAILVTWGGAMFFVAGIEIYDMIKDYKQEK